jgi:hypothetical protein
MSNFFVKAKAKGLEDKLRSEAAKEARTRITVPISIFLGYFMFNTTKSNGRI